LPDGCQTVARRLPDGCQAVARRLGSPEFVQQKPDGQGSVEGGKEGVMPGQIFKAIQQTPAHKKPCASRGVEILENGQIIRRGLI